VPLWRNQARRRLAEPFVGGLAVTLGLSPKRALLNDANPHVIAFYRALQNGLNIPSTGIAVKNDRDVYYRNRERFNALVAQNSEETAEAAALFYYLNRTGFNGLCRFNNRGFFNVPFGRYKTISYREDFTEYAKALRNYEFTTGDFEDMRVNTNDFIYADPPYDVEFTSYSAGGFDFADQKRLAQWLAKHPGPVVASNQATPRIKKLYRDLGFSVAELDAPRRISCDGNRDDAREILAVKNI
jgi:DNA adenine methylase